MSCMCYTHIRTCIHVKHQTRKGSFCMCISCIKENNGIAQGIFMHVGIFNHVYMTNTIRTQYVRMHINICTYACMRTCCMCACICNMHPCVYDIAAELVSMFVPTWCAHVYTYTTHIIHKKKNRDSASTQFTYIYIHIPPGKLCTLLTPMYPESYRCKHNKLAQHASLRQNFDHLGHLDRFDQPFSCQRFELLHQCLRGP
jgi:hypothetical protein